MTIKKLIEFKYENYYRRIGFPKENSYYSMKHLILPNEKLVKRSKRITH